MKFTLPDKKYLGAFAVGLLWGAILMFIGGTLYLRHSLIVESECQGSVEQSIAQIQKNALKMPSWQVQQASCSIPETSDGAKIYVLRLCNPGYAAEMLELASDRKFSAAIPCGISFYKKPDGKVYMAKVNMPLLSRLFGGEPAYVMNKKAVPEQHFLMNGVLKGK